MSDDKPLELRSIIRRFADSTEALDGLNERMKSLAATAETLAHTNAGVSEMAGQMRSFVEEASRVGVLLSGAIEKVQRVIEMSVHFLDGGDLSEVKAEMHNIKALLENQLRESQVELARVNSELAKRESEFARLAAQLAQVQVKLAKLPPRVKKKYWD
jgi:multidrug resistance efflux pump